ncbi:hypothetical protein [Neisseria sp.]|uniref:hypothetical protein n=1 Tax=Neisseria sp. TaxID=192066 RepID=UPI00359F7192
MRTPVKFRCGYGLLPAVLLMASCVEYSNINYRIGDKTTVQVTQPTALRLDTLRVDVESKGGRGVLVHIPLVNSGRYVDAPPYAEMVDGLVYAMQDTFSEIPVFDVQPRNPAITLRATFREFYADDGFLWSRASVTVRYQFIRQNRVFYETEIRTEKYKTGEVFSAEPRIEKVKNEVVAENLVELVNHLNRKNIATLL